MSSSTRLQVLQAIVALARTALPFADVKGLEADDAKPDDIPPGGLVIVRAGDPGEPAVDLSPVRYNWEHRIPLEVAAYRSETKTSEVVLDEMLQALGAAIEADRTLGGLVDWLDAGGAATDDADTFGAEAGRWADLDLTAAYATTTPLN